MDKTGMEATRIWNFVENTVPDIRLAVTSVSNNIGPATAKISITFDTEFSNQENLA